MPDHSSEGKIEVPSKKLRGRSVKIEIDDRKSENSAETPSKKGRGQKNTINLNKMDNKPSDNTSVETPSKKGRGQPRNMVDKSSNGSLDTPSTRSRGQPRKSRNTGLDDKLNGGSLETPSKKSRGSPRKAINLDELGDKSSDDDSVETPPKKGRGQSRNMDDKLSNGSLETPSTRSRCQPRKSINLDELGDKSSDDESFDDTDSMSSDDFSVNSRNLQEIDDNSSDDSSAKSINLDEMDDEPSENLAEAPSKKGRGKKKTINLDEMDKKPSDGTSVETPSKKGQGSPKKSINLDEMGDKSSDDDSVETTPKKGRGKKKTINLDKMEKKPSDDASVEIPSKKGRGQPRKSKNMVEKSSNSSLETPSKRSRGSPRKTINLDEMSDKTSNDASVEPPSKKGRGQKKAINLDELGDKSSDDDSVETPPKKGRGQSRNMDDKLSNGSLETPSTRSRGQTRKSINLDELGDKSSDDESFDDTDSMSSDDFSVNSRNLQEIDDNSSDDSSAKSINLDEVDDKSNDDDSVETPSKKGRDRPKKSINLAESDDNSVKTPSKKGRDRPKKSRNLGEMDDQTSNGLVEPQPKKSRTNPCIVIIPNSEAKDVPPKKGRGRPKKALSSPRPSGEKTASSQQSSQGDSESSKVNKGKGRQKKSVRSSETQKRGSPSSKKQTSDVRPAQSGSDSDQEDQVNAPRKQKRRPRYSFVPSSDSEEISDSGDIQPKKSIGKPEKSEPIKNGQARQYDENFAKEHPRNLIPTLCQHMFKMGWMAGTGGSFTMRHDGEIYVTPSGVSKECLLPEDLFILNDEGKILNQPAREKKLKLSDNANVFRAIYSLRDAGSIIHSHSLKAVMITLVCKGKEFRISNQEMIKGVLKRDSDERYSNHETLVIPIIENLPSERDLKDDVTSVLYQYPMSNAVLIRRHGLYVWGKTWKTAKGQAESLDYLFELALEMDRRGIDLTDEEGIAD